MYFSIFSSLEHYSYKYRTNDVIFDKTEDICVICWMPEEKNNMLKHLPDFSHISTLCKCHPQIHYLCLNNWINKNKSCPICRTKLHVNILKINDNIFINYYTNFIKYTIIVIRIITYASFLHLICLLVYNIYIIANI